MIYLYVIIGISVVAAWIFLRNIIKIVLMLGVVGLLVFVLSDNSSNLKKKISGTIEQGNNLEDSLKNIRDLANANKITGAILQTTDTSRLN